MNNINKIKIDRLRILEDLQECVRQCEDRFRGRTELATEFDKRVLRLCQVLEEVFNFGLKRNRSLFRITKDLASKGLSKTSGGSETVTFWLFVRQFLNKHEHERYLVLKNVKTDLGRGRAWMRSALNENSLQRYLMAMFDSSVAGKVSQFYEDWSIISSAEHRQKVMDASQTLSGILFAINIDRIEFDMDVTSNEDQLNSRGRNSRDPEAVFPSLSSSPSTSVPIKKSTPRVVALADDEDNDESKEEEDDSTDTHTPYSTTPVNTESFLSRNPQLLLTPLEEDNRSITSTDNERHTSISEAEKELTSSDEIADHVFSSHASSNEEDLKTELSEVMEEKKRLEIQLMTTQKTMEEKLLRSEATIESLTKENDILKIQVKKYLSAIQMLNNSEPENKVVPPTTENHSDLVPSYVLYQEAQEYEKKLIQVAEMHGELVEFNDRLHRVILQKESMIKRLREELIELRGPLPEGVEVGENDDISSVHSEPSTPSTLPSNIHRPLVNVWIPTAFLAGNQKSSSHHVYQVYIRIKDEEWNVYRRYSQFYDMHCKLQKTYPMIGSFDFPPKKTFSKRDARVVQERRKRLEAYLRSVVNIIQVEHEVHDRRSLTRSLPFLGLGDDRSTGNAPQTSSRSEEGLGAGSNISSHQYLGL